MLASCAGEPTQSVLAACVRPRSKIRLDHDDDLMVVYTLQLCITACMQDYREETDGRWREIPRGRGLDRARAAACCVSRLHLPYYPPCGMRASRAWTTHIFYWLRSMVEYWSCLRCPTQYHGTHTVETKLRLLLNTMLTVHVVDPVSCLYIAER